MNRQITKLAVASLILLAALIVGTTYWQTWASAGLAEKQDNAIQRVAQFCIKRGVIRAADGTLLATNVRRRVGGQTLYSDAIRPAGFSHSWSATRRRCARARVSSSPRTPT